MSRKQNKSLIVELNDIPLDPALVSSIINRACRRGGTRMLVTGAVGLDRHLILALEPARGDEVPDYIVAPLPSSDPPDIIAEINVRFQNETSTIAGFSHGDAMWGLFARRGKNSPR